MKLIIDSENDYVKNINIECSPVEFLLLKTGLELVEDNPNLNPKDRHKAKKMIEQLSTTYT